MTLQQMRRRVYDLATRTPVRHAASPIYAGLVRAELALERVLDRARTSRVQPTDVTVLIKTFERPNECARLIASVQRIMPSLEIVVVDDSKQPRAWPGARTIELPYDSGASVGRNKGLEQIHTELFVLFDDDHIAYRDTDVSRAASYMRANPQVDIYAGQVFTLPFFEPTVAPLNRNCFGGAHRSIGGFPVYDRTDQFFVGRTKRVLSVGWEPRLKTAEHTEFFWRARKTLTSVFDERMRVLHAKTPFNVEYMKKRTDVEPYLELLSELMK